LYLSAQIIPTLYIYFLVKDNPDFGNARKPQMEVLYSIGNGNETSTKTERNFTLRNNEKLRTVTKLMDAERVDAEEKQMYLVEGRQICFRCDSGINFASGIQWHVLDARLGSYTPQQGIFPNLFGLNFQQEITS